MVQNITNYGYMRLKFLDILFAFDFDSVALQFHYMNYSNCYKVSKYD